MDKPNQIWIHHTDTSDGWKDDIVYSEREHLEATKLSDGFTHYVEYSAYEQLKAERDALIEPLKVIEYVNRGRGYPTRDEWGEMVRLVKQSLRKSEAKDEV